MTELLDKAVETARALPNGMQDEIARMVLAMAGASLPIAQLSPKEEASLAVSLRQAAAGSFAPMEDVQVVWAKHGL